MLAYWGKYWKCFNVRKNMWITIGYHKKEPRNNMFLIDLLPRLVICSSKEDTESYFTVEAIFWRHTFSIYLQWV